MDVSPPKAHRGDVHESHFLHMPRFGAWLYDWFMRMKPTQVQTCEVAQRLVARIDSGRLLDIGTGPGRLLLEIHRLNPRLELFGLDISPAMIEVAQRNLSGIAVELCQGRAEHTGYADNFFDLVTCTGSLYLWDSPEQGMEEIFRILKPGRSAYLFEVHKDVDPGPFAAPKRARNSGQLAYRGMMLAGFLATFFFPFADRPGRARLVHEPNRESFSSNDLEFLSNHVRLLQ